MEKVYELTLENSNSLCLVDTKGYELAKNRKWREVDNYVVEVSNTTDSPKYLHRELMNLNTYDGILVDHINHNTLDNRLSNLRLANRSQNSCNRGKNKWKNASSIYKGVRFLEKKGYYQVRIQKDKKPYTIGHYYDEIASANMYNHFANLLHGEFAFYNDVPHMSIEECDNYKVKRGN